MGAGVSLRDDLLPSQLPDPEDIPGAVFLDWETSGLYPDDGARVASAGVAFRFKGEVVSFAWPFNQGLYGKPEAETARFGWDEHQEVCGYYKNDSKATGAKAGDPKYRKVKRKLTAEEVLPPNPNLGPDEWAHFMEWLSYQDIAAHNLMFEVIMAEHGVGPGMSGIDILPNGIWCTLLGNHLLDPRYPKGLKETCDRLYGDAPDEQKVLLEHLKSRGVPTRRYDLADWDVIRPYLLGDVRRGIRLAQHQYLRFRGHEAKMADMDRYLGDMDCLIRQERRGLVYRADESLRWAEKIAAEADQLEAELPFRSTNPGAVQFFFTKDVLENGTHCLGLDPVKMTEPSKTHPHGQPGLDAEVIDQLAQRDVPHARRFYQLRQLRDANSRYYRGYAEAVGPDGRLRTRFRQIGTKPGRISCERTNLQAIPHDHRLLAAGAAVLAEAPSPRALVDALPGFELWHMDLMQAELRVATQFAKCERMWETIEQNRDPHGETAIGLGLVTGPEDPGWYKGRSVIGKRSNFSLIFGIGHVKFRADLRKTSGLDLERPDHICLGGAKRGCQRRNCKVKELVEGWHELYPEFRPAIDIHMQVAEHDKRILVRDDHYRYWTELEILQHDYHKAFNNKVQGNIGLFTKAWMCEVDDLLMSRGIPDNAGLLLQIHDALLLMLPVGMRDLAEECADIAREMWKDWFEIPGGVDVEPWKKEKVA
jgi:DNA polymerase family A